MKQTEEARTKRIYAIVVAKVYPFYLAKTFGLSPAVVEELCP